MSPRHRSSRADGEHPTRTTGEHHGHINIARTWTRQAAYALDAGGQGILGPGRQPDRQPEPVDLDPRAVPRVRDLDGVEPGRGADESGRIRSEEHTSEL